MPARKNPNKRTYGGMYIVMYIRPDDKPHQLNAVAQNPESKQMFHSIRAEAEQTRSTLQKLNKYAKYEIYKLES